MVAALNPVVRRDEFGEKERVSVGSRVGNLLLGSFQAEARFAVLGIEPKRALGISHRFCEVAFSAVAQASVDIRIEKRRIDSDRLSEIRDCHVELPQLHIFVAAAVVDDGKIVACRLADPARARRNGLLAGSFVADVLIVLLGRNRHRERQARRQYDAGTSSSDPFLHWHPPRLMHS
jgi:hypothetical protein